MSFIKYNESLWDTDKLYCYELLSSNPKYNLFRAQYKSQSGVLIRSLDNSVFIGSNTWTHIWPDQISDGNYIQFMKSYLIMSHIYFYFRLLYLVQ